MQTCQILDLARFTVNLDVGVMIFHENKVEYSVTWEKFSKVQTNANERGTFQNFYFSDRKVAGISACGMLVVGSFNRAVHRQPGVRPEC